MKKSIFYALIVMLIFSGIHLHCDGNGVTTSEQYLRFTLEYDRQYTYDVFVWGDDKTREAFSACSISLKIEHDSTLEDGYIRQDSLIYYFLDNVQTDSTGQTTHSGWLCGIKMITDSVTQAPIPSLWGVTYGGWSYICKESEAAPFCIDKTIIHELGHQIATLPHLCWEDSNWVMNREDHSDSACVVGQGEFPHCTYRDLCEDPHFCSRCRRSLINSLIY